jgi:hypothetical protein
MIWITVTLLSREQVGSLTGQQYNILELEDAIVSAEKACQNFQWSRQGQTQYFNINDNNDPEKLFSVILEETYSLCGEVEVSIRIIQLILKADTFVLAGEAFKSRFLFLLQSSASDLGTISSDTAGLDQLKYLNKQWKRHDKLFGNLYRSTKHCLFNAFRLMTDKHIKMEKVAEYSTEFVELFGVDILKEHWSKIKHSRDSEVEKLSQYKTHFGAIVFNNFRTLVELSLQFLLNYQEIALEMDKIIENNAEIEWEEEDMVGYVNLFFCITYSDRERLKLPLDKTKKFCGILLGPKEANTKEGQKGKEVKSLKPELLAFFLVLHWPTAFSQVTSEDQRLIYLSIKLLKEFNAKYVKC